MRTTVTLDPDAERRLREVMKTRNLSFKEALNEAIRCGVDDLLPKAKAREFRTQPEDMGVFAHVDYDNIGELLELTEKEARHGDG